MYDPSHLQLDTISYRLIIPTDVLLGVDRVENHASGLRDLTRDQLGEAVAQGIIFIDERC